jgi:hypothetical protein
MLVACRIVAFQCSLRDLVWIVVALIAEEVCTPNPKQVPAAAAWAAAAALCLLVPLPEPGKPVEGCWFCLSSDQVSRESQTVDGLQDCGFSMQLSGFDWGGCSTHDQGGGVCRNTLNKRRVTPQHSPSHDHAVAHCWHFLQADASWLEVS